MEDATYCTAGIRLDIGIGWYPAFLHAAASNTASTNLTPNGSESVASFPISSTR